MKASGPGHAKSPFFMFHYKMCEDLGSGIHLKGLKEPRAFIRTAEYVMKRQYKSGYRPQSTGFLI